MSAAMGAAGQLLLAGFSLMILLLTAQVMLFIPLTPLYERWKRRTLEKISLMPFTGKVSVIVPAYNEEAMLRTCLESLLASNHQNFEIIVVNDGSTDRTEDTIADMVDGEAVRYFSQANGGKAAALNLGGSVATGEVLVYTDADSLFAPETLGQLTRWFADPGIDAVCGNDTPLNARTSLQKVLAVTSHIGTGFVRRALSMLGILPIISGNLGAVRTEVFHELKGFRKVWGEDLEFTFRLQAHGKTIVFDPAATVRAECPSTLPSLWKQRIRWVRSYLKVSRMHLGLFLPQRSRPFSFYLPFNYFAQIVVPVLQLLALPLILKATVMHDNAPNILWFALVYFGLLTFLTIGTYSILMDGDVRSLRYVPYATLLIIPLSYFYDLVVAVSICQEMIGSPEEWRKSERLKSEPQFGHRALSVAAFAIVACAVYAGSMPAFRRPTGSVPVQPISVREQDQTEEPAARTPQLANIAVATHFDGWPDWHMAIDSVLQNPASSKIRTLGISAGRVEWAHFQWRGHQDQWSAQQKKTSVDMLKYASTAARKRGLRSVAIVDVYSPLLLTKTPAVAAIRFDGAASKDQVCFTELVDGDYGRRLIEMVSYLARSYPVDAIALTELSYSSSCFDDRCLMSYHASSGKADWPRDQRTNRLIRDDPSVWEWRSSKMEAFLKRAADAVHAAGKQLIVDVPVSWADLHREGRDAGLEYSRVLRQADQIVIWDYFGVDQKPPAITKAILKEIKPGIPVDRFYLSIGLWGAHGPIAPESLQQGVQLALSEGAKNIWITPNELLSQQYWSVLQTMDNDTVATSSLSKR